MCGISALLLADKGGNAVSELYESLNILQHRGQDAAGIVTCGHKGRLFQCKGNGMVRDVFDSSKLENLKGYMGIGHVRYPTAGTSSSSEAQPFYVNSPYGLVIAHNGNLTNDSEIREFLDIDAHRHINTDSDSELLLNILADELQKTDKIRITEEDIFSAAAGVMKRCRGAYACVFMVAGFGLVGFRDPNGIRPLVYGSRSTPLGDDWMFASESVALDVLGFRSFVDVNPGEVIIIPRENSTPIVRQVVPPREFTPCIFEYVYFARPDSIMDRISVYKSRLMMGEKLAEEMIRLLGHDVIKTLDVVIPVPDTSRTAALQMAHKLGIPYREGFIKNRYVGRTFIMPGQNMRRQNVRRKLNPMALEFKDKNVLIVDGGFPGALPPRASPTPVPLDSIVRGTTSREIVSMAREVGARKVYFASCAPPIRYPNVYGIDMPTSAELVAHNRTEDEIAQEIGADSVIFQRLDDLISACSEFNPSITNFECSVFNSCYVTGDITAQYLRELEALRKDSAKSKREHRNSVERIVGLHNMEQNGVKS
ncbi:nucleophile aminohydrolase [Hyaloraphidium curvatum]|nr:nucleophile aminohydrolase [Hyaloraphidium curvatum]